MAPPTFTTEFLTALHGDEGDLASAALQLARLEYPRLDRTYYLERLNALGTGAAARLTRVRTGRLEDRVAVLSRYLFEEEGFSGNREQFDDPRNSFLNEVLDRRTGIPISLALVYMEVGRRAGVRIEGVNFPGHFLLRCPAGSGSDAGDDLIIDPFGGGTVLSEGDCRQLLREHAGEQVEFGPALLAPASKLQIVTRMLVNLKRSYVRLRSFPQARAVSSLLLAIDPAAITELRDRGLLSYHMEDFGAALRDLQDYIRFLPRVGPGVPETGDEEGRQEYEQIWEYVKALRRRVASFN